jgi:hypothetical protein
LENQDPAHFPVVPRRKFERGLKIFRNASNARPDK